MQLTGILETAIYVADLAAAKAFYQRVFGLVQIAGDERFAAFDVSGRSVLLLFHQGASLHEAHLPGGGNIPPHDGSGPTHFAFSIPAADLPAWEAKLATEGIPIEGRATWSRGGQSVFFRDLDGHLLELATPGVWTIY
jgi:catechol 2,3-dioxygenase-like lactoylglutathione lyase family enzyme